MEWTRRIICVIFSLLICSSALATDEYLMRYNTYTNKLDWTLNPDYVEELMWVIPPIIEWYDPTDGLPVDPTIGDRYGADATANGWTIDYIYEWDGTEWVEEEPEEGWMVWDLLDLIFYTFFSGGWMEMGEYTYVPYEGAIYDVDLGSKELKTTGHISSRGFDLLGNYIVAWRNAADTETYAYIGYDGDLTIRNIDDDINLKADSISINGKTLIGDGGTTNYTEISATGNIEPHGSATYKANGGNAGITQSETGVTDFDIVIEDGLITSFTKN